MLERPRPVALRRRRQPAEKVAEEKVEAAEGAVT